MSSNRIGSESRTAGATRRVRRDGRVDENITVAGYITPIGETVGWTGDEEAPYVKPIAPLKIWVDTNGGLNSQIVANAPAEMFQLHLYNTSATKYELQLFNKKALPILGDVPKMCFPFPALGTVAVSFGEFNGRDDFTTGIVWAISSTSLTYTPSGGAIAIGSTAYILI